MVTEWSHFVSIHHGHWMALSNVDVEQTVYVPQENKFWLNARQLSQILGVALLFLMTLFYFVFLYCYQIIYLTNLFIALTILYMPEIVFRASDINTFNAIVSQKVSTFLALLYR